jgi:hypothetical protein
MQFTFNPGIAVLLLILFAFQPVVFCVAVPQDCPHSPATRNGADCCFVSATPVSPVSRNSVQAAVAAALPNPVHADIGFPEPHLVIDARQVTPPRDFSIVFRQLLI